MRAEGGDASLLPRPANGLKTLILDRCGALRLCGPIWYAILALAIEGLGAALAAGIIVELRKDQFGPNLYLISNGSAILQSLLSAPGLVLVGHLSQAHRLGRRRVMLVISIVLAASKMIYLVTYDQYVIISFTTLLALTGLGNGGSLFVVLLAWITDWCRPEDKVKYLGLLGGSLFGAAAASNYLAALFPMSRQQTFQVTALLSLLGPLYFFFVFPAAVPPRWPRAPSDPAGDVSVSMEQLEGREPPAESPEPRPTPEVPARSPREPPHDGRPSLLARGCLLIRSITGGGPCRRCRGSPGMWKGTCDSLAYLFKTRGLVTLIYLAINFTNSAEMDSAGLFLAKERGFGQRDISALVGTVGLGGFLTQCVVVPAFSACGVTPQAMLVVSILAMFVHFLNFAFLTNKSLIIMLEPVGSLGFLGYIASTAIISGEKRESDAPIDQGVLMGSLQGLKTVATCVGPLMLAGCTTYWELFPAPFNFAGVGFVFLACIMVGAFVLAARLYCTSKPARHPLAEG